MTSGQDTVVLVHGLWVHGIAMEVMRRRVARHGFRALAYSYPSMRLTLAQNAELLARYCRALNLPSIHLVGHSLGGLIVLHMLDRGPGFTPGRIVLAGVPVAGSFAARRLSRLPGGRAALGRSLPQWFVTEHPALDRQQEIGVIAGRLPVGLGRLIAPDLPEPSDGVVSAAETRFPAMCDHITLNVSHSGMLVSQLVVHQMCEFLRNGAFAHRDEG